LVAAHDDRARPHRGQPRKSSEQPPRAVRSIAARDAARIEFTSGDYRPQADVGIIDIDYEAGQRFVEKAYLLAEVSSEADEVVVPGTDQKWVDVKREIYRSHGHCEAVLVVAQDRMEVEMNLKTETGWKSWVVTGGDAEVAIPAFGFWCVVGDLYEGTPLKPRVIVQPDV
jgi:hypothetical protein